MPPKAKNLGAALAPEKSKLVIPPLEVQDTYLGQVPTDFTSLTSVGPSSPHLSLPKKTKGRYLQWVLPQSKNSGEGQSRLAPRLLEKPPSFETQSLLLSSSEGRSPQLTLLKIMTPTLAWHRLPCFLKT